MNRYVLMYLKLSVLRCLPKKYLWQIFCLPTPDINKLRALLRLCLRKKKIPKTTQTKPKPWLFLYLFISLLTFQRLILPIDSDRVKTIFGFFKLKHGSNPAMGSLWSEQNYIQLVSQLGLQLASWENSGCNPQVEQNNFMSPGLLSKLL